MKISSQLFSRKKIVKDWPDYYTTINKDFTHYVKDYEKKYWRKESAFGVKYKILYKHVFGRLSEQLAGLSLYVESGRFRKLIGQRS